MTVSGGDKVGIVGGYIGGIKAIFDEFLCNKGNGHYNNGGGHPGHEGDRAVTRYDALQTEKLNDANNKIGILVSEKYTDHAIACAMEKVNHKFDEITNRICYDEKLIQKNTDSINANMCYVESNFIRGSLKINPHDICPAIVCSGHSNHANSASN